MNIAPIGPLKNLSIPVPGSVSMGRFDDDVKTYALNI